jgi:aminopeptidase
MGARFVDVLWGDDQLALIRLQHAPRDSFEEFPVWVAHGMVECAKRGDAFLTILANDPDLLKDQDPELIAITRKTMARHMEPYSGYISRNAVTWLVISAALPEWASKMFPNLSRDAQEAKLWDAIFTTCRLDQPDPIAAWQTHIQHLVARCDYMNHKQYAALELSAPGTDLTIGLPKGHIWQGGHVTSEIGVGFTPNLPTEEIFTLPHRERTEGVVHSSKPLNYSGVMIENFSLTFANGRVANVTAEKGETLLRKLIETDDGAGRLGEIALVPYNSPISRSGLLFYNTLFDENAASHIAVGRAYKFCLSGSEEMSNEEFARVGGNTSLVHVDFMIGSDKMAVDGITAAGAREPLMRGGEWVVQV